MDSHIKLIIFDAGDVIYDTKRSRQIFFKEYEKFLKKFGKSSKETKRIWEKLYPKLLRGRISLREVKKLEFEKMKISKQKLNEWLKRNKEIKLNYTKPIKGAKRVLLKLKKLGLKIAILSDTVLPRAWRNEMFNKIGIKESKHYNKRFDSNVIGFAKPDEWAYLTVLKYFNVKPNETIFVGHDKEEIEGAKRLGIKTIAFRERVKSANFYARDWNEIYRIIVQLGK